ncbi:hypothetical protein CHUUTOTORO_01000 [Serratia phage vB_SmaM-ChuuTotoro]|nr:hypothetical protein CHUUTOTORO_01000 [Serratia phage vB_SmaM-ChuuTotoro]
MARKQTAVKSVPVENTKWHQRGFTDKHHYQGWLQFNDLIDEGYGYDDTYHDQYSGKTIRISASPDAPDGTEADEAAQFLNMHDKQ